MVMLFVHKQRNKLTIMFPQSGDREKLKTKKQQNMWDRSKIHINFCFKMTFGKFMEEMQHH